MLGAICGDILGSVYEWNNIKHCPTTAQLLQNDSRFTDDSVMTVAVTHGIAAIKKRLPDDWFNDRHIKDAVMRSIQDSMVKYGSMYPNAGYGGKFRIWLSDKNRRPYNSWGNGSAMRVSAAGWAARSLEEALCFAECSAAVTHNHPEGVKGAQVVAGAIYILRSGGTKKDAEDFARKSYDLDFTLDEIRPSYTFDVSCQGSVPQAVRAFSEGGSFEEVISLAISIGGDSDTIAAIAGSMAEVIYPIPDDILSFAKSRLDPFLLGSITASSEILLQESGCAAAPVAQ